MVAAGNKDLTCAEHFKILAVAIALPTNLKQACFFAFLVVGKLGAIATVYREVRIAILPKRELKRLTISRLIH